MKALRPILFLLLGGCATSSSVTNAELTEELLVTGFPHLPRDALAVVERLATCNHFAGEFTGGNSRERDAEVREAVAKFGCATIEKEADALRAKYKDDNAVQDALTQAAGL